jgi:hypothetical protein
MKTAAYTLQEEQIEWLKKISILEQGTASQILRRVLREAMEREGYNPLFVSTETVIHNAPATPEETVESSKEA